MIVPLLILSDMGSMWLIRYSDFFAGQLYISGMILATCFLVLFVLTQWDLWQGTFRKTDRKIVSKKVSIVAEKILKILDEASEPVNVKEIDFRLHFDHAVELIHMSLGWLVREGIICAEVVRTDTYMVRPNSQAHNAQECHGTHKWIKNIEMQLDQTPVPSRIQ